MVIDSHQHFWRFDPARDSWISDQMKIIQRDFFPVDLKPILQKNGIDGCVAVQADQSETETTFLLGLAESYDFIKGVVGWVDLRGDEVEKKLENFSHVKHLRGFRHIIQAEPAGFMIDDRFIKGVRSLSKFGFTYDLLIYHHQLPEALKFLSKVSEVRIVFDHIAKPSIRTKEINEWEKHLTHARSLHNVYCKLSGMVTEAKWKSWKKDDFFPYIDKVFEIFGPRRIMYGSDWPVCLVAGAYEDQLAIVRDYISRLTSEEKESVMGRNAERFYNL